MVGGGSERYPERSPGYAVCVGKNVGGSGRNDVPRRYYGIDGKGHQPLPPGRRVPRVQGNRERNPKWVAFFVDDAISLDVQWKDDRAGKYTFSGGGGGKRGSKTPHAEEGRHEGHDHSTAAEKDRGLATAACDNGEKRHFGEKLLVWPELHVFHRFLGLAHLHLIGEERRGGGDAWDRLRERAKAERR